MLTKELSRFSHRSDNKAIIRASHWETQERNSHGHFKNLMMKNRLTFDPQISNWNVILQQLADSPVMHIPSVLLDDT